MRARLLGAMGFAAVVEQPFDRAFSCLPAEDFVARILAADLGIAHVVTGYDFHFGKDRRGTPQFLIEAGKRLGFGVTRVDAFCDEGADAVSSSRIRTLLAGGEVAQAAGLLGYRYTVEAEISHGRKLGRTLGFPTANMALPEGTDLAHGIYAVRLRRQNGALHDGVASFGRRPTVTEDGAALLETFLFDFSGDLYGETACVSFFGFLRGEKKFDGLDVLTAQMKRDEAEARALLSGVAPLSQLDRAIAF
jgi:riboflavin kinase/FMN adenylyltransferase